MELEHTTNRDLAEQIAKDHLQEDPQYYQKLKRFHLDGYEIVPSDDAGARLLNGKRYGLAYVAACWAGRAAFIAPALYIAGVKDGLIKKSLLASAGVTAFGLVYLMLTSRIVADKK